jgi:2-C-methyl-D-erythritol 4-phosphate cytidylyltransferase/2-C-methyl-D-erythritol 2,4-cyclodiphosphate synthase
MTRTVALVVAAGRGTRLGGDIPKQWRDLAGRPVLRHSLDSFIAHPGIEAIRVVIHPDDMDLYRRATLGLALAPPIAGGATRQDSVRLGLEALAADPPDFVLIHDGARPFVAEVLIDRVIAALSSHPGAIPAMKVSDTLKRGENGTITATVPRDLLWRAQTPQGFVFASILEAHQKARGTDLTDDAAVAERAGLAVALVEGDEDNVKLTTAGDLKRAASRLSVALESRTASGFDVHKFCPGDHVMLGGIRVPHTHGLEGHSDADAGLHALTDALLGTIGAGDIGVHFPPDDARWKGADSAQFLAEAARLVRARGGEIVHVDLTVICERPKVTPWRTAIVDRIAAILEIASDRVSVKATTTEGLGFTGRREGIAAQGMATVKVPGSAVFRR